MTKRKPKQKWAFLVTLNTWLKFNSCVEPLQICTLKKSNDLVLYPSWAPSYNSHTDDSSALGTESDEVNPLVQTSDSRT